MPSCCGWSNWVRPSKRSAGSSSCKAVNSMSSLRTTPAHHCQGSDAAMCIMLCAECDQLAITGSVRAAYCLTFKYSAKEQLLQFQPQCTVQPQANSALSKSKIDTSRMCSLMHLSILDLLAGLLLFQSRHTAGVPVACHADILSCQARCETAGCMFQQGAAMVI